MFGSFTMESRSGPPHERELLDSMRHAGALNPAQWDIPTSALRVTMEQEEAMLAHADTQNISGGFERTRMQVLPCLQAIVREAFERLGIEQRSGIDIGSGVSGFMKYQLLPTNAQTSWIELELQPRAVAEHRDRFPHSPIVQGSYLRLKETGMSKLDCVTGLSSLDATQHLDTALYGIGSVLKPGGYLLHVQDVRPGMISPLFEIESQGMRAPFAMEKFAGGNLATTSNIMTAVTDRGPTSTPELFRRWLGKQVEATEELELVENNWVTARVKNNRTASRHYFGNVLLQTMITENGACFDEASAVVTVARRKNK